MIDCEGLGRIGVIANPSAGAGPTALRAVLAQLLPELRGSDVVVCAGTSEAEAADACGIRCRRVKGPAGSATGLTRALLDAGIDTVIGIGGDGTLGEIGSTLSATSSEVRLLGVGVGSSNVGPLVATAAADLGAFLTSAWVAVRVHALDVRADGRGAGLAFHDVTVANTFFATRDGRRVDVDAGAALRGEDRVADPVSACGPETWVAKNGRRRLRGADLEGGQVIASPLNDTGACRGKAVSGFLCWGPYVGCLGVVAATSSLMIRTRLERGDLEKAEPLRIFHLGLAPEDVIEMGGFLAGAALVVDGTPRCVVTPAVAVSLRTVGDAVVSIRRADDSAGTSRGEGKG